MCLYWQSYQQQLINIYPFPFTIKSISYLKISFSIHSKHQWFLFQIPGVCLLVGCCLQICLRPFTLCSLRSLINDMFEGVSQNSYTLTHTHTRIQENRFSCKCLLSVANCSRPDMGQSSHILHPQRLRLTANQYDLTELHIFARCD